MNSGRKRNTSGAAQVAERDPTALAHAVDLIFGTCCLAGAPSVIADVLDEDELNAIGEHDTAALFNMLVVAFSYQGTSDVVAHDYMQRHGRRPGVASNPNWTEVLNRAATNWRATGNSVSAVMTRPATHVPSQIIWTIAHCQPTCCEMADLTKWPTAFSCSCGISRLAISLAGSTSNWRPFLLQTTRHWIGRKR